MTTGLILDQKNVLILGGAGFLGCWLARRCHDYGARVIGIGHAQPDWNPKANGYSDWRTSYLSYEALGTISSIPDIIFHCAGGSSVGLSLTEPYRDFSRTVGATAAVLEYIRNHAPQARLVLVSSAAVYGNGAEDKFTEEHRLSPVSPYGLHKKISEELVESYTKRYGVRSAAVRLFSVYGSGLRKQLLWDACHKYSSTSQPHFSGTGEEERDWLHVADACELLIIAALNMTDEFQVLNGGMGVGHKVREVLTMIGAQFASTTSPVFDGVSRPGDPRRLVADISKAQALGFRPSRMLEEGIHDYASWYQTITR